ncbi:MAG TPA: ATP-dependent helicase HrpB [Steroidobacteraceae bacterium]|nr:ATP-dependent helicase HrpB [Steroidobacteraceae bacterium]
MPKPNLTTLPIESALPDLMAAFAAHRNVVLEAPPGAGKSTRVPLALLESIATRSEKIVMLEPRRLAARAVAQRMSQMLGEPVGETVGFRTRLETKVSKATRIEVVTEGILTRWLQRDQALEGVGIVIFDEFHERSLNADLGLALCLDAQQTLREDLRLLVMSATLHTERIAALLDDAPTVSASGRMFPIETHYRNPPSDRARTMTSERDIPNLAANVVARGIEQHDGDVLVFLAGQGEILRTQRLLQDIHLPQHVQVLPLFGDLSLADQDAALRPAASGLRKVVLATNIAETSLTIEGVRIVVDSGWARRARFDPASGMSRLEAVRISRASADQRRGRAGRTAPGVCYRLWTESEDAALIAHTPPEILEADLAPLVLELAQWGVVDPSKLQWLDAPPAATYNQAADLLKSLQALDADGRITAHGRAMAELSTHPRLAHMILRARDLGQTRTAIEIAALLAERDILRFEGPHRDVDLRHRLDALHGSVPLGARIDAAGRSRVQRSIQLLQRQITPGKNDGAQATEANAGRLLAFAYPDRIAQSRGADGRYLLASGRGAQLPDAQSLAKSEFLVAAELEGSGRDASIRLAAPITRHDLETDWSDRIETRTRVEWDSREQAVIAQREQWLGTLKLLERRLDPPPKDQIAAAVLEGIRQLGLDALPWTKDARALQQRIEFARRTDTRSTAAWPQVSDSALLATLEDWLTPWLDDITRRSHLTRLDMHAILLSMLPWDAQQRLNAFAPTHLPVPSGSRIPIDYANESPTVSVRLQEVFGMRATPAIADGAVPLTLELLSPAHRPVQVTRDLMSFWARGYPDVKKELKGRYPKHHWPDDPLTAEATSRAKRRSS